ncbi:MAG TPA: hypothetical protein VJ302_19365 [Blastocatellia bacterium]|nr:hypothetical protein [Blastocatellia bacterium]
MFKINKRIFRMLLILSAVFAALVPYATSRTAKAMPMFARKLGVSCSTCHTSPPRLNEVGYQFRAAGYRMPSEIGKGGENQPFNFFNYNGVRLQARYDATRSRTGPDAPHDNNFNLFAAELYAFTGAWGKHLSSNIKATIYPEKAYDTEDHLRVEGNVKLTFGNENQFFEVRAGVPHPMEGFGASDVAITNTRPYFQENPADFNQSTFFTPWNFHQAGVTLGYYRGRTAVRALMLAGVRLHDDDHDLEAFGRREPFTHSSVLSPHRGVDLQLLVNRIINANGGSLTFYYYNGNVGLPIIGPDGEVQPNQSFQNNFNRVAFYASYPVAKRLTLLGGVLHGRDDLAAGGRFNSLGAYTEAVVPIINDITHAGVRFDWFDPARGLDRNELRGVTTYVNLWVKSQFRFVAEYQRKDRKQGDLPHKKDHAFQLRLIFIK